MSRVIEVSQIRTSLPSPRPRRSSFDSDLSVSPIAPEHHPLSLRSILCDDHTDEDSPPSPATSSRHDPFRPSPSLPSPVPSLRAVSPLPPKSSPRPKVPPPVPVPNLIKKSRGRRVPTVLDSDGTSSRPGSRNYVCQVKHCGKRFSRGEHLKRHIRSIHTNEKPFKCPFPHCDKYFSRFDNLTQHQKVHEPPATARSPSCSSPISP